MTKEIALTFDDGPWPATSPRVYEALLSRQIPATFMLIGERVAAYGEMLSAVAADGHYAFGNHTYHHVSLFGLTDEVLSRELSQTDEAVEVATGAAPGFVRPPYGDANAATLAVARRPMICWSLDTKSWDHHDPSQCLANIHAAKDGDIVLMHDFQEAEAVALPAMLDYLMAQGFSFKTVPELLGARLRENKIFYSRDAADTKGFDK